MLAIFELSIFQLVASFTMINYLSEEFPCSLISRMGALQWLARPQDLAFRILYFGDSSK